MGYDASNPMKDRIRMLAIAARPPYLNICFTSTQPVPATTAIGMVEGGLGVAIMTSAVVRLATSMGLVVRTPREPHITREVSLIQKRARSLSPAARRFRDYLLKSVH